MNIQKAINVIDKVSILITEKVSNRYIAESLENKMKPELFRDLMDRWYSKQGDLFDFYLNTDSDIQRYLLEALDIEVEPDKYPDYESRVLACLRDEKSRWEVYPFETEVLYQYMLFGFCNSLEILKTISSSAWQTVEECKIDSYGNYLNWSIFWLNASPEDKIEIVEFLIKEKELMTTHPDLECMRNQAEFLNSCPKEVWEQHARLFRWGNAAYRYHQLTSSIGYDRLKFFYEEWLQGLPADVSADMRRLGFEGCKTMVPFTRYVNERTDIGMDEWMKDHLSSEDYKNYKKSEQKSEQ